MDLLRMCGLRKVYCCTKKNRTPDYQSVYKLYYQARLVYDISLAWQSIKLLYGVYRLFR